MRVLLVQSLTENDHAPIFPLGLCYVASDLTDDVHIFDMNITNEPYEDLVRELTIIRPSLVGVSLRNIKVANPGTHHSSFANHEKTIKIIKKIVPKATIVVGGPAFSLYAEEVMKKLKEIDYGIFGEGEQSFPELINNLKQPESVRGVYYRRDGKVFFTGFRDWIPSGGKSLPRRDLLDIGKYADTPYSIGVQTKRGCVLKCIHCSDRYLLGEEIRLRKPSEVVNEIEHLVKENKVRTFSFVDQVFNIPINHSMKICEEIIRRDLSVKWTAWLNEKYINEDFLKIAKKAGCTYLSFSPDSASTSVIKKLRKNFTARELSRTYELARKYGMKVEYSFMINAPGETIFTLFQTLLFIVRARFTLRNDFMLHNLLMTTPIRIYPHTEIKEIAIREGLVDRKPDLIESVFYNPAPLKYIVSIIAWCSRMIWGVKKRWGKRKAG